jgi:hypothetical protein
MYSTMGAPVPESTLFPRQGLRIWPQYRYCVSHVGAILPQPSEKVEAYLHIFYVFPKGFYNLSIFCQYPGGKCTHDYLVKLA